MPRHIEWYQEFKVKLRYNFNIFLASLKQVIFPNQEELSLASTHIIRHHWTEVHIDHRACQAWLLLWWQLRIWELYFATLVGCFLWSEKASKSEKPIELMGSIGFLRNLSFGPFELTELHLPNSSQHLHFWWSKTGVAAHSSAWVWRPVSVCVAPVFHSCHRRSLSGR